MSIVGSEQNEDNVRYLEQLQAEKEQRIIDNFETSWLKDCGDIFENIVDYVDELVGENLHPNISKPLIEKMILALSIKELMEIKWLDGTEFWEWYYECEMWNN